VRKRVRAFWEPVRRNKSAALEHFPIRFDRASQIRCKPFAPVRPIDAVAKARSGKPNRKKSRATQGTAVWPRPISRATMLWGEIMTDIPKPEPWPKNDRRMQSEWRMRTIRCKEAPMKSVCRELSRALAGKAAEASFPKSGYQFSDKMMRNKGI